MATKRSWYYDALDEDMQKGRKQSIVEAAKRVAENFNIDVETAYKIVTGTSTPKQESMKGMNLFKG